MEPKVISPTDPAARYTASANSVAGYAYSDNYLVDLKLAVIMDVEATTTIRQAEVGAAKTMLDRTAEQFDFTPSRLVADGGYGSAEMVGARDEFLLAATAKICGNWRSSSASRSRSSSREADRPSFTSLIDAAHQYRARPKTGFFNEIRK